jgi:hypothetical protein
VGTVEAERVVLEAASEMLVAEPGRWTYGALARDRFDWPCDPAADVARRWSAFGALVRFGGEFAPGDRRLAWTLAERAAWRCSPLPLIVRLVNDQWGYWPVMGLLQMGLEPSVQVRPRPRGMSAWRRWQREEIARVVPLMEREG